MQGKDGKEYLAVFDLDGTLFDTGAVNYHAYSGALEEKGYRLDYEYFCRECNGKHYTAFLPEILDGNTGIMEEVHRRKKELYHEFLDRARPNGHLLRMLKRMKPDYRLAVVTTASRGNTMEILGRFGIREEFDLVLTQEDISRTKPDPEGFIKAMEYFKIGPENTVVFEDSEIGIEAAMACGASVMKCEKF